MQAGNFGGVNVSLDVKGPKIITQIFVSDRGMQQESKVSVSFI